MGLSIHLLREDTAHFLPSRRRDDDPIAHECLTDAVA